MYTGLTMGVVGLYIATVTVIGGLLGRTAGAPILAVALVAVVANPMRERLRHRANRLVYGVRDEPWVLITRLADRLRTAGEQPLTGVTSTIADALRLSYVAIEHDGQLMGTGAATAPVSRFPLVHQGKEVGSLLCASRGPLGSAERRLLEDLAPQLAVAVHAGGLTDELQRSRERVVVAREEERRRVRRDLHDGVGPTLAAVALGLETARDLVQEDPTTGGRCP